MSEAETALIAAGIAAVTTFVGAVITAVVAIRNERQRSQATKQEAFVQELRSRTADVFGQLLAMQHSMEWLTWHAQRDPASVSRLHEQYEEEVHRTYPQLLGAMAVTAALDLTLYSELRMLVNRVYELEGEVAISLIAAVRRGPDQNDALRALAGLNPAVTRLYEELPIELAEAMQKAQVAGTKED
jgi:hypothetical protein